MKRVGASVLLAVPAAVLLLASTAVAAALGMGWALTRFVPLDLFQATLICLVALSFAGTAMARLVSTALGLFAAQGGARLGAWMKASRGETPAAPLEPRDPEAQPAEGESPRRRGRFDA